MKLTVEVAQQVNIRSSRTRQKVRPSLSGWLQQGVWSLVDMYQGWKRMAVSPGGPGHIGERCVCPGARGSSNAGPLRLPAKRSEGGILPPLPHGPPPSERPLLATQGGPALPPEG